MVFRSDEVRSRKEWQFFLKLAYRNLLTISDHLRYRQLDEIQARYPYVGYTTSLPVIDSVGCLCDHLKVVSFPDFVARLWRTYSETYAENAATYASLFGPESERAWSDRFDANLDAFQVGAEKALSDSRLRAIMSGEVETTSHASEKDDTSDGQEELQEERREEKDTTDSIKKKQ